MLVTSSQSSTQRPLGLSVEELFALDRQYRHIEQQQHHLAQLQAHSRLTSSNLNRLASRSLDLVSSPSQPSPLSILPSLEVHGHGCTNRPQPSPSTVNYLRSHSIDQLKLASPPSTLLKHTYPQNDVRYQHYQPKYRSHLQQPMVPPDSTPLLGGSNFMYDLSASSTDYPEIRGSCRLRRQQPLKRESSRRIVVRPVIQRRREPSISSSCESLDEVHPTIARPSSMNSYLANQSVPFNPSASLINDVIDDLIEETKKHSLSDHDEDDEVNLYEMRVPIGKTYDTSDISVQLEGPKILIHCHTIEPTDKRGNYRKHELKTELIVPDVVDDETITAYLTEDGELIVEGKYHLWAWKEMKTKRQKEGGELGHSSSLIKPKLAARKTDERERVKDKSVSSNGNRIEKLDDNRTVIHVGESLASQSKPSGVRSINDTANRFKTLNKTIWDGQYLFTNDCPPLLIYHLRLPLETLMDAIRIQSDPRLNILKIFIEQQEKNVFEQQQRHNEILVRSTSRLCRLPRDHRYDYTRLRVNFLPENFIRIELPTL